jgi:sodium transport system permease protein
MSWSNIRLILAREIRDQLRDRRTMFLIFVLPVVLYPLLIGLGLGQLAQSSQKRPSKVWVIGARGLPESPPLVVNDRFAEALFKSPDAAKEIELTFDRDEPEGDPAKAVDPAMAPDPAKAPDPVARARQLVETQQFDAALYFPPDFGSRIEEFRRELRAGGVPRSPLPRPVFICSEVRTKSLSTQTKLRDVWDRWNDQLRKANLAAASVSESVVATIQPEMVIAEKRSEAGIALVSKFFPVLLVIWALTGAFYPAVDLCAGEKERGTLETLLSSPAARSEIVLGKLLTIMLFSAASTVLNLVCMSAMGMMMANKLPMGSVSPDAALWLLLALVPLSALFSALCLAIASFARSTKEGQYYLVPLLLVAMPLAAYPIISDMELNLGTSLIPIAGIVLLLRSALEGHHLQALQFLPPVMVVTLAACWLSIRWAIEQFNSESVLFRESERLEPILWMRNLFRERQPTPTFAAAMTCGMTILLVKSLLMFLAPQGDTLASFVGMMVLVQVAAIVAPTLLFTMALVKSPAETLLFRRPASLLALPAAVVLAIAMHPIAKGLEYAIVQVYPVNQEMRSSMEQMSSVLSGAPLWQLLLLMAVLPAVCEELTFRGFLLSGFRRSNTFRAIALSALFFGFTHFVLQQQIAAAILGLVIGLIAVRSGSIFPCILFHLTHNGFSLTLGTLPSDAWERWPLVSFLMTPQGSEYPFRWTAVILGGLISLGLLLWFCRLPTNSSLALKSAPSSGR